MEVTKLKVKLKLKLVRQSSNQKRGSPVPRGFREPGKLFGTRQLKENEKMKINWKHEDKSCVSNFLGNREHQNRNKYF